MLRSRFVTKALFLLNRSRATLAAGYIERRENELSTRLSCR
jgi:hypothetical protein